LVDKITDRLDYRAAKALTLLPLPALASLTRICLRKLDFLWNGDAGDACKVFNLGQCGRTGKGEPVEEVGYMPNLPQTMKM
jgi:hypothetical protein